ncbi:MAG: phosphatidate cytidylyltransferase [Anaplasmataceae bacterium]|nr:phosphatidate cytidylyltransferase [Anaplasmataceae bacterium]
MVSNFIKRCLSAVVMLVIVCSVYSIGGPFVYSFFLLIGFLAEYEVSNLLIDKPKLLLTIITTYLLMFFCSSCIYVYSLDSKYFIFISLSIILTDICAYFGGKYFKGIKLMPFISPGKTVSGAMTGLFCGGLFPYLLYIIYDTEKYKLFSLYFFITISVLSQLGDLLESALKRYCKVKDSSNIIPGHGGILDRIDGFLISLPYSAFYLYFNH